MPKITETKLKAEIKELIELIKLIPTLSNPLSQLDCISLSPSEDLNSINSLYQAIAYYWECYLNNEEKSISFDSSKNKNEIVINLCQYWLDLWFLLRFSFAKIKNYAKKTNDIFKIDNHQKLFLFLMEKQYLIDITRTKNNNPHQIYTKTGILSKNKNNIEREQSKNDDLEICLIIINKIVNENGCPASIKQYWKKFKQSEQKLCISNHHLAAQKTKKRNKCSQI